MFINLVNLGEAFLDGSRQVETHQTIKYDRFFAGEFSLPDNLFQISVIHLMPAAFEALGKPRMQLLHYETVDGIDY